MVVVDVLRCAIPAQSAEAALLSDEPVVVSDSDAVTAHEVVVAGTAVPLP